MSRLRTLYGRLWAGVFVWQLWRRVLSLAVCPQFGNRIICGAVGMRFGPLGRGREGRRIVGPASMRN